jgi:hypothetical protein
LARDFVTPIPPIAGESDWTGWFAAGSARGRKKRRADNKTDYVLTTKLFDLDVVRVEHARPSFRFAFHVRGEYIGRAAADVHAHFFEALSRARRREDAE